MKTIRNIVIGLVVLIGVVYGAVMFFSAGARDHARGFVEDVSAGEFAAAHARLHPQLQQQLSVEELGQMFEGIQPYVDVSFTSISMQGGRSDLTGTATTASDCTSQVQFTLFGDDIDMFNITPLCPEP